MKKKYENPTIQKIAFSYRDQVVAASGADFSTGNGVTESAGTGTVNPAQEAWNNFYNSLPGWAQTAIDILGKVFG